MGSIGNSGNRNVAVKFTVSADSYGITDSEAKSIENFVTAAVENRYEDDGDSIATNIKPKDRERLAQSIADTFKNALGWNVDVSIRRKTEGGNTSRLRGGGKVGKTVWTAISYRKRG